MDAPSLFRSVLHGTRQFSRAMASEVHEWDGVVAAVVPACPERSVLNCVSYEDPDALMAALPELARIYDDAGVLAWTVWVPHTDRVAAAALEAAGHALDASPAAMGMALDGVLRPASSHGWTREGDPGVVAYINDVAYGYPDSFQHAIDGVATEAFTFYVADSDGRPASCCVALDEGVDCHMTLVATLPDARGRGMAGALMAHALADGRERGLETSTLVATKMGRPVYERLGYSDLGPVEMWERRVRSARGAPRT